jgi:hypothetical protein
VARHYSGETLAGFWNDQLLQEPRIAAHYRGTQSPQGTCGPLNRTWPGTFVRNDQRGRTPVYFQQRLATVRKVAGRIVRVAMENGKSSSQMFIDATYEAI